MHLIFAAAVALQIHTGQELLSACTASDTATCDAFIQQTLAADKEASCMTSEKPAVLREAVVEALKQPGTPLKEHAAELVSAVFASECAGSD